MIQYISKWLWHVVIEFWNNGGSKANHPEPFSLDAFVRIRFGKLSTLSSGDLAGWLGTELKSDRPANHVDVAGVTILLGPFAVFRFVVPGKIPKILSTCFFLLKDS